MNYMRATLFLNAKLPSRIGVSAHKRSMRCRALRLRDPSDTTAAALTVPAAVRLRPNAVQPTPTEACLLFLTIKLNLNGAR